MNDYVVKAFACYNKDAQIRFRSTSGGVFYAVAAYILEKKQGVVCGAKFDENFVVRHAAVDSIQDLPMLCGSKYPQSDLGDIYKRIKQYLAEGVTVLFAGTPCQVAGLQVFLGGKPDNLYCMDFVCHGVASPRVWSGYLDEFTDRRQIQWIRFKDKTRGWKHWYTKIQYKSGGGVNQRGGLNPFMRSYLARVNMRPSCFKCRFKGLKRASDFTIADCWGIGEKNKRLNDDRGLSAFLINSPKGEEIFGKISDQLTYEEYDPEVLMRGNPATFESSLPGEGRERFYRLGNAYSFGYALRKTYMPSMKNYFVYYVKRFLGKEK